MNQIPQQQMLYPNIYPQIQGQQIPNQFPQQVILQHQINQISQNNIPSQLNFNSNEQRKFIIFKIKNIFKIIIGRRRRSKHEKEGRIYQCECGKSYLSQPALNNHKKTKHPELLEGMEKRGRGRPRKYIKNVSEDFENEKYDNFFDNVIRKRNNDENYDVKNCAFSVYDFLFNGKYKDKLFSQPEGINDIPILKNLIENDNSVILKDKGLKNCNDIFYQYVNECQKKCNEKYFILLLKFILLFRECENLSKNKDKDKDKKIEVTSLSNAETIPESCNEFYSNFLETNNFFDIDENDKTEIIELIQHFCIWLFKNDFTKSKLSLAG